jgi:hypothetical protein
MIWEYYVECVVGEDARGTTDRLNKLGQDGWELIAVRDRYHYFKRPLPESAPKSETTLWDQVRD